MRGVCLNVKLVGKVLGIFVALMILIMLGSMAITIPQILCIYVVVVVLICFMVLYKSVLKPIEALYSTIVLMSIRVREEDLSKLDDISGLGFSEIKDIVEKFRQLARSYVESKNTLNSTMYESSHDQLTGLYNRHHLESVQNMYEMSKSIYVIFFDVNNLKKMNDTFGHEAGDVLLKTAGLKLRYWTTYGDVYRLGGDEYLVVVMNKSKEYCDDILNHWYDGVGCLNRESDGFKCLLSYGVSYTDREIGKSLDELVKEADEAMYDMKVRIKTELGEDMR